MYVVETLKLNYNHNCLNQVFECKYLEDSYLFSIVSELAIPTWIRRSITTSFGKLSYQNIFGTRMSFFGV